MVVAQVDVHSPGATGGVAEDAVAARPASARAVSFIERYVCVVVSQVDVSSLSLSLTFLKLKSKI